MTRHSLRDQVSELELASSSHVREQGQVVAEAMVNSARPLMLWTDALHQFKRTGVADDLLNGVNSSIAEAVCCSTLGLARASLLSLRAQIDMMLGWIYFKDHKMEWDRCDTTGDGFKLKHEITRYLEDHVPSYKKRLGLLQGRSHSDGDIYRFLSAHIHGQRIAAIPKARLLQDHVDSRSVAKLPDFQREVSDYLGFVLCAVYANEWLNFGPKVMSSVEALSPGARKSFFE